MNQKGGWRSILIGVGCALAAGCSGSGAVDPLDTGSIDGFVFVPSRSAAGRRQATGGDLPQGGAQVVLFEAPRQQGADPLRETTSDSRGQFRFEDLPLGKPYLLVAQRVEDRFTLRLKAWAWLGESQRRRRVDMTAETTLIAEWGDRFVERHQAPLSGAQIDAMAEAVEQRIRAALAQDPALRRRLLEVPKGFDISQAIEQLTQSLHGSATGTVQIDSRPAEAAVVINGHVTSLLTPRTLEEVPPGVLTIAVRKRGYLDPPVRQIEVRAGQTATALFDLEAVGSGPDR